jgi:hypothetical protein
MAGLHLRRALDALALRDASIDSHSSRKQVSTREQLVAAARGVLAIRGAT